eukprot:317271_1
MLGDTSINKGKLLQMQHFVMFNNGKSELKQKDDDQSDKFNIDKHKINAKKSEKIKIKLVIVWEKGNSKNNLKQFNVIYENKEVYQLPEIPSSMYFGKRYAVKLIMLESVLKYETIKTENAKSKKTINKTITIKECCRVSGAQRGYLRLHWLHMLGDEIAYNKFMATKDIANWVKKTGDDHKQYLFDLSGSLTDIDKRDYTFSMNDEFMVSFQALFGNYWKQISKIQEKDETDKKKRNNNNNNNNNNNGD